MTTFVRSWWALVLFTVVSATSSAGDVFAVDARKLQTTHTSAVLTDEFFGGRVLAIKICYSAGDIVERDGEGLTSDGERAYLVLFIDEARKIQQVNMTVVFKGMTYGNTITADSDAVARNFADYSFDGTRLRLHSEGSNTDTDVDGKPQTMRWKVATDVTVQRRLAATTKK